jgi:hypothetical protein
MCTVVATHSLDSSGGHGIKTIRDSTEVHHKGRVSQWRFPLKTILGWRYQPPSLFFIGGLMEKFLNILWFTFLYQPLTYFNGLSIILLANEKIIGGTFRVQYFRKKKKQEIDKKKFAKFMRRVCK